MMLRRHLARTPAAMWIVPLVAFMAGTGISNASAQSLPEIRTHERNAVPACVTPSRLMRFLGERNPDLPAKFRNIATHYKTHGERLRVRWDYAFFQMILETNYLQFRNARGPGDVRPSQNNFAGIGTTGGGVPGDSFPDVSTGVLGQFQHLIAYSGERVDAPVARRTREKQDDIISASRRLKRPVTFRDLAGRWAVDRRYAKSIAFVADQYRQRFCTGRQPERDVEDATPSREIQAAAPPPAHQPAASSAGTRGTALGTRARASTADVGRTAASSTPCKVFTASYGGTQNVLIRRRVGDEVHFTALQVLDGREDGLTEAFIRTHAQGGEPLGRFSSREEALTSAFNQCPGGITSETGGRG